MSNPTRNIHNLNVFVVSYDQGIIGQQFVKYFQHISQNTYPIATITIINPNITNQKALYHEVHNSKAWAIIYVPSNASEKLLEATKDGCHYYSTFNYQNNLQKSIIFAYDQERNNPVATTWIILPFQKILQQFLSDFASFYLKSAYSPSELLTCLTNNHSHVLTQPISYLENNLTPASTSPLSDSAMTIGNMLIAVFNTLFVSNALNRIIVPSIEKHICFLNNLLIRISFLVLLGFGLACAYATIGTI